MAALTGMRVLDMTQYEAGTSCTQVLAWLGADVVKVERPGQGDPGRSLASPDLEHSGYFHNWNANKRSITLALERDEGRALLLQLAPRFDVFVENFGPGVVEKLGLGYDAFRDVHPDVIYASLKGFGSSGPYADYKCFDMVAQAAAGAFSTTGTPDGPPLRPGPTTGDAGTGLQLALAITAAYAQKLREGVGQQIEISMQEAMTFFMRTNIGLAPHGVPAPRIGNGSTAALNLFPCKPFGPNDYVYVMAVTGRMRTALRDAIGRPELAPEDVTIEVVEKWTRERTKFEAMRELAGAGIPASAVYDTPDLFRDPHLQARGFVRQVEHPVAGTVRLLGFAPRLSASDVPLEPAPVLGAHTDEVLARELGLAPAELAELRERGTIG